MSQTIVPESEMLHRALLWISGERAANPATPIHRLVDDAAMRYDLSPAQQDWLMFTLTAPPPEREAPPR